MVLSPIRHDLPFANYPTQTTTNTGSPVLRGRFVRNLGGKYPTTENGKTTPVDEGYKEFSDDCQDDSPSFPDNSSPCLADKYRLGCIARRLQKPAADFNSPVAVRLRFDDDQSSPLEDPLSLNQINLLSGAVASSPERPFKRPSPLLNPKPKTPLRRSPFRRPRVFVPSPRRCSNSPVQSPSRCFKAPPSPRQFSPPHKRLRALRLFDIPHTPRTLIEKAQSSSIYAATTNTTTAPATNLTPTQQQAPVANINPFTPEDRSKIIRSTPPSRSDSFPSDDNLEESPIAGISTKGVQLRDIQTSRYREEFVELEKLGDGQFGSVFRCLNRLDGCIYAVKKSNTPVAGSSYERTALNEVYAHAVLGKHPHVVRYYSAWAESGHMFIQSEYCNGGSLLDRIEENKRMGVTPSERELKSILTQLARGLRYIHSLQLAHMDIKPGNVFISYEERAPDSPDSAMEEDLDTDSDSGTCASPPGPTSQTSAKLLSASSSCSSACPPESYAYKIGDLGHVTPIHSSEVEEGDCRYLPREVLQENYDHLSKADIFSLALTIIEAAGHSPLPKNGPEWHTLRDGVLPSLENISPEFADLLQQMISPDAACRPSACAILNHVCLRGADKSRDQLRRELNEERFKNKLLLRQLQEAEAKIQVTSGRCGVPSSSAIQRRMRQQLDAPHKPPKSSSSSNSSRLLGKGTPRSLSGLL